MNKQCLAGNELDADRLDVNVRCFVKLVREPLKLGKHKVAQKNRTLQ